MAKKKVAAIITEYRRHSHADVIVGKILEGWHHEGGGGPNLELVSAYIDQFPKNDWSRDLSKKHNFPITKTIEEALLLGRTAIDHGKSTHRLHFTRQRIETSQNPGFRAPPR